MRNDRQVYFGGGFTSYRGKMTTIRSKPGFDLIKNWIISNLWILIPIGIVIHIYL